jgi:opacity protein-like surface antigen
MGGMMVKQVVTVASLILLFASHVIAGQSGYYAGVSSGLMLLKSTLTDRNGSSADLSYDKIGIPVSAFVGYQFGVGLRVEGEAFYKSATTSELRYSGLTSKIDSKVSSIGAMGNVYYDFFHDIKALADGPFSPYVGLGVGFANVDMSAASDDRFKFWNGDNDTVFAYQVALGSGIPIYKNFILDVSYRYFGTTGIAIDQIKADFNNHNFLLGVRYLFR